MKSFNWSRDTWSIIDKYFENPDAGVQHQLDSFNNLIDVTLPLIIQQSMPLKVSKGESSYQFKILRIYLTKPLTHEDETTRPLLPNEARLRDMTYSGCIFIDIEQKKTINGQDITTVERKLPLCRFPIMLGSKFCHLHGRSPAERGAMGECPYDRGGYFIVNGSEKVIIGQERPVDNKVIYHKGGGKKKDKKYVARAEIKSTIDQRFHPIKACAVYITAPATGTGRGADPVPGQKLKVGIPYVKNEIPLFVMFRALGIVSDRSIFSYIFGDAELGERELNLIIPSVDDALYHEIRTQYDALRYISLMINYTVPKELEIPREASDAERKEGEETIETDRIGFTVDLLNREFLPHVGMVSNEKAHFLGYMTRKLIRAYSTDTYSDRDHYSNKRVNVTGPLLAQIFRSSYLKLIKEIKESYMQMLIDGGTGSAGEKNTKIRRIIQKCSMESRLKYALATGNWITSRASAASATKTGIAQVLQRIAYNGKISHLRRIQSPLEKDGSKQEAPRRYHSTQIGKICPNETPEGQQVGIVKNMSLMCFITVDVSYQPVLYLIHQLGVKPLTDIPITHLTRGALVFVNGRIAGVTPIGDTEEDSIYNVEQIYKMLKKFKQTGKISPYCSVSWVREEREIHICTDGGRYCRPLYIVDPETNRFKIDTEWDNLQKGETWKESEWYSLLVGFDAPTTSILSKKGGFIEYLDTNEENESMIAFMPHQMSQGRVFGEDEINGTMREFQIDLGFRFVEYGAASNSVLSSSEHLLTVGKRSDTEIVDAIKEKCLSLINEDYKPTLRTIFDKTNISIFGAAKRRGEFMFKLREGARYTEEELFVLRHINRLVHREYVSYSHCELHSSMFLSVVSQMIPYSNHNQSPRNCYQCVHKDTKIKMADGGYKKISDVYVGEKVVSVDPTTYKVKITTVVSQYVKRTDKKIVKLATISGRQLICTDDHPILQIYSQWTEGRGAWRKAGELAGGDFIAVLYYETGEEGSEIQTVTFDEIKSVEPHQNVLIADITIDDDCHSFVTESGYIVHNSSMGKQALGIHATNHSIRMDTAANILVYPQRPVTQTRTAKYTGLDDLPHGMQCIVAIQVYTGYNQEDSKIVNKSAVERGLFNSEYYHTYESKVQKHLSSTGSSEKFGIPPENTVARRVGSSKGNPYKVINPTTGFPLQGSYVDGGDILIAKYTETEGDSTKEKRIRDASTTVRHSEGGLVDWVIPNANYPQRRNGEGFEYCKVRLTDYRHPEIGDKLASRHAQKGTIGMLYREEDMPFTESGVVPDIIMNPHAIPSRMTIGQLIEAVFSKSAVIDGEIKDATTFTIPEFDEYDGRETEAGEGLRAGEGDAIEMIDCATKSLAKFGFDYNGNEVMYNGQTGQMFEVAIFINPTYYQRLKHMVADKQHARNKGPVQLLTRQPAEGRSRDGGLRIGEMERDGILGGGCTYFLKEKTNELSDIFQEYVNKKTGWFANVNPDAGIYLQGKEEIPEEVGVDKVILPFANSLFLRELRTMGISAQMTVE